jgi:tetratricopeptide (TPR) repeat protein
MGDLATRYPDDPEAQVLHAEALMLLSPWNYWTAGGEPRPGTETLLLRLTRVIEADSNHPGACHFYIHAVEAAHPERAVPCAERLPGLMPGAGHIVHMPAHVYVRVGRYADAITANEHAVHADEQYIADRRPDGLYPLAYYPHNYHFLDFAAQMAGQSATALHAARTLAGKVDVGLMHQPGLETLQHFFVAPLRAMVRFGKWREILNEPPPPADLPYAAGVSHWARGLAMVRTGDSAGARRELAQLQDAADDPSVTRLHIWNINPAVRLLQIGAHMLAGEIASASTDWDRAIDELRAAVRLEDGLTYDEPPTWELPVRHYLGATLLAAGRPADAEAVYREDLARFPRNGWSLFGLAQALAVQQRAADASRARAEFQEAWRTADVTLMASRF